MVQKPSRDNRNWSLRREIYEQAAEHFKDNFGQFEFLQCEKISYCTKPMNEIALEMFANTNSCI